MGRVAFAMAVIGVMASGGCKAEHRPIEAAPTPAPEIPRPPAPADSSFTREITPPAPYDRFVPLMSHAEVVQAIADAGLVANRSALPSRLAPEVGDSTLYGTKSPHTFAFFQYDDDDRLAGLTFVGDRGSTIAAEVTAHWGAGESRGSEIAPDETYDGPQWNAVLHAGTDSVRLTFQADLTVHAPTANQNPTLWRDLGGVIGKPLDAAAAVFGSSVVNHAVRIATPWADEPWQVALEVDPATQRVVMITATGHTESETARIELVSSLKAAFGEPHPTISSAGHIEIAFVAGSVEVRMADTADDWTIAMRAVTPAAPGR